MRTGNWGAVDGENALLGLGTPQSETAASLFPHSYPRHFCRQRESWLTTVASACSVSQVPPVAPAG